MTNTEKTLIKVGFWNGAFEDRYIWPQELVGDHPNPHRCCRDKRIIGYLKSGHVVGRYMGYSACRICGGQLGTADMTDGKFVWPEMMEHYVERHDVLLPEWLVAHASTQGWSVPAAPEWLSKDEDNAVNENDFEWASWCLQNRDPDKQPSFPIHAPPTATGDGELTTGLFSDLFSVIEWPHDSPVEKVEVPSKECLARVTVNGDPAYDEMDGKFFLWTAKVMFGKPLVKAYGIDDGGPQAALAFVDGEPVLFCSREGSMFNGAKTRKAYCPELELGWDKNGDRITIGSDVTCRYGNAEECDNMDVRGVVTRFDDAGVWVRDASGDEVNWSNKQIWLSKKTA